MERHFSQGDLCLLLLVPKTLPIQEVVFFFPSFPSFFILSFSFYLKDFKFFKKLFKLCVTQTTLRSLNFYLRIWHFVIPSTACHLTLVP